MLLYLKIVEYVILLYLPCYLYKLLYFFKPLYVAIINAYYVMSISFYSFYIYTNIIL